MEDEHKEDEVEEEEKVEEKVEDKAKEEEPKPDLTQKQTQDAVSLSQGKLDEEQIKQLEKNTGFTRSQLATVGIMINNAITMGKTGEVISDRAKQQAEKELFTLGVKDFGEFSDAISKELEKLSPAERQSPELVKNLYWIEKGKRSVAKPSNGNPNVNVQRKSVAVESESSSRVSEHEVDEGVDSLSEDEKNVCKRSGIKTMKEWKQYSKREIDVPEERNWQPDFRKG